MMEIFAGKHVPKCFHCDNNWRLAYKKKFDFYVFTGFDTLFRRSDRK